MKSNGLRSEKGLDQRAETIQRKGVGLGGEADQEILDIIDEQADAVDVLYP